MTHRGRPHLPRRDSDRGMRIDPRGSMNAAHCPCCTLWFNSYVRGRGALIVRSLLQSFSSKYHGFQPCLKREGEGERETRWIFKLLTSVLDVVRPRGRRFPYFVHPCFRFPGHFRILYLRTYPTCLDIRWNFSNYFLTALRLIFQKMILTERYRLLFEIFSPLSRFVQRYFINR